MEKSSCDVLYLYKSLPSFSVFSVSPSFFHSHSHSLSPLSLPLSLPLLSLCLHSLSPSLAHLPSFLVTAAFIVLPPHTSGISLDTSLLIPTLTPIPLVSNIFFVLPHIFFVVDYIQHTEGFPQSNHIFDRSTG